MRGRNEPWILAVCVMVVAGCATEIGSRSRARVEGDDPYRSTEAAIVSSESWALPASTLAAGATAPTEYDDSTTWDGGAHCTGDLLAGSRELGDFLRGTFGAISRVEGYACRQNTANRAMMSVHGTGRALDIYIPKTAGDADNYAGDPIANWLVEHAAEIGIQYVIWDRTKWNRGTRSSRASAYGGPHPHDDHIHVELTVEGAARMTAWFAGTGTPTPAPAPPPPPAPTPGCSDGCPYQNDGMCDDGGPGSLYSVCDFGTDCGDCGPRSGSAPAPTPPPAPAPGATCNDSCAWSNDGYCDDGGPGSTYVLCAAGTDCTDCGASTSAPAPTTTCTDDCRYAADGWCDDGGSGSDYSVCAFGTDCVDCGVR